jgi:hypothetical protein
MVERPATMPFTLPYGLKNTVATYASSASTSLSVYADLSGHHLRSTLDLIATPPTSSYPEEVTSYEGAWAGADFSGPVTKGSRDGMMITSSLRQVARTLSNLLPDLVSLMRC